VDLKASRKKFAAATFPKTELFKIKDNLASHQTQVEATASK